MANQIPGGWSDYDFTLTPEAKHAFDTAMSSLLGVKYVPFAFASQTVQGLNYSFLCEAQYATQYPSENAVSIRLHQPPGGKAHLVSIRPIVP